MQQALIILSSISVLISYGIYEWAMVKGKARPHRTTQFVLMVLAVLAAAALWAAEDRVAFWLLFVCALQSTVTFLMSFKWGMGGLAKTDIVCLVIAIIGIVVWQVSDRPALGLYASIAADLIGMIPTLIKTYRLPHTEYWPSYIFGITGATLTLIALPNWGWVNFSYPAYWVAIDLVMLFLIFRPKILPKPA